MLLLLRLAEGIAVGVENDGHYALQCYEPSPQLDLPDHEACQYALNTMRQHFNRLPQRPLRMGSSQINSRSTQHVPVHFIWTRNGFCLIQIEITPIEVTQPLSQDSYIFVYRVDLVVFADVLIRQCVAVGDGRGWGGKVNSIRDVGPRGDRRPMQAYLQISVLGGHRFLEGGEQPYNQSSVDLGHDEPPSLPSSANVAPPAHENFTYSVFSPSATTLRQSRTIERRQPPSSPAQFPDPMDVQCWYPLNVQDHLITACLDTIQVLRHWSRGPDDYLIRLVDRSEPARPGFSLPNFWEHRGWDQSHHQFCLLQIHSHALTFAEYEPRYLILDLEYMTAQLLRLYRQCPRGGIVFTAPNRSASLRGHDSTVGLMLITRSRKRRWPWSSLGVYSNSTVV